MLAHAGRRSRHLSSRVQQTSGHRPSARPAELFMAHISAIPTTATLRHRLDVSSWWALRAVAHSAESVQSVAAQSAARRIFAAVGGHRARAPQSRGQRQHNSSSPSTFTRMPAFSVRHRPDENSPLHRRAFAQHCETSRKFKFNQLVWLCFPQTVASITVGVGASATSARTGAG